MFVTDLVFDNDRSGRSDGRHAAVASGVARRRHHRRHRRGRALHQPVRRPSGQRRWRPRTAGGQGGQETRVPQPWTGQFRFFFFYTCFRC